ncbi:MAG TPA: hypothetical protein VF189_06610 [Patescibacteria group bacterium]
MLSKSPDQIKCTGFPFVTESALANGKILQEIVLRCDWCGRRDASNIVGAKDADTQIEVESKRLKRQARCPFNK